MLLPRIRTISARTCYLCGYLPTQFVAKDIATPMRPSLLRRALEFSDTKTQSRNFSQTHSFSNKEYSNEKQPEVVAPAVTSKWLTVPNLLTFSRMALSPYIGYLVLNEQFPWAFALVFVAGLTDSIDGWIARNFKGQSSILGSFIDPLADKVMISCLTLSLTAVNIIPAPLCALIVTRDLMIASAAGHFHYKHIEPPRTLAKFFDFEKSTVQMEPTQISKYNTFLQLGLVALSISAPIFNFIDHPVLQAYWYLVATSTVLSGLSYVVKDKSNYNVKK